MSERNQPLEVQDDKAGQRKSEPASADLTQEMAGLEQAPGGPRAAFDDGSIEDQAARLGDRRLQGA